MQDAVGDAVCPVHGDDLEQRMHAGPAGNGQQHVVAVFAAVEHLQVIQLEFLHVDFGVVLLDIVPQRVHMVAPAPAHQHERLAVEVGKLQPLLRRQPVPQRDRAAERLAGQLRARAAAQLQHGLVEDAAHHVDVPAQMGQDFPGVFRRVVKGENLKPDIRAALLYPGPHRHQKLRGRHGRGADADQVRALLHGVAGAHDRVLAVLHNVLCILQKRPARGGERKSSVRALKQPHLQAVLQQIDLLDDRRGRDIHLFRRPVEAARLRHAQERFKLWTSISS